MEAKFEAEHAKRAAEHAEMEVQFQRLRQTMREEFLAILANQSQCENVVANHDEKVLDLERVNELNQKLLDTINRSGHVYMSPNVVDGVYIIRCAVRATLTEERRDRGLEEYSRYLFLITPALIIVHDFEEESLVEDFGNMCISQSSSYVDED
nr:tyrosine/dopa decarboxylase 5 [Quercus suber]